MSPQKEVEAYDIYETGSQLSDASATQEVLKGLLDEMKASREAEQSFRREQAQSRSSTVFQYKAPESLPILGDTDHDLEAHLTEFEDFLSFMGRVGPKEKLCLFGRTLRGVKKKCFATILKDVRASADYERNASLVLDQIIASIDASFHEPDEAKSMRAREMRARQGRLRSLSSRVAWRALIARRRRHP